MTSIRGAALAYACILKVVFRFDRLGRKVRIHPSCDIRRGAAPYIHIGDGVQLQKDVWLNIPLDDPKLRDRENPIMRIGDGTRIGRRCSLSGLQHIELGRNVLLGPGVLIMDHAHEFTDPCTPISKQGTSEPGHIIIEEGCWLGHNSAVVTHRGRELRIGRNSVVGANAVVTRSFPAGSILVGAPARDVRREE